MSVDFVIVETLIRIDTIINTYYDILFYFQIWMNVRPQMYVKTVGFVKMKNLASNVTVPTLAILATPVTLVSVYLVN